MDDIAGLPLAIATFGQPPGQLSAAERVLEALGVLRHVQVTTVGWLPLPFVVAGTDLVAILPERLARRAAATVGVAVCEPVRPGTRSRASSSPRSRAPGKAAWRLRR